MAAPQGLTRGANRDFLQSVTTDCREGCGTGLGHALAFSVLGVTREMGASNCGCLCTVKGYANTHCALDIDASCFRRPGPLPTLQA